MHFSTKTFIWNYSTKTRLHFHLTKSPRIYQKYDVLNALSSDHSSLFCSISKPNELNKGKGKGLWKFNNSLISNTDFFERMKQPIELKH